MGAKQNKWNAAGARAEAAANSASTATTATPAASNNTVADTYYAPVTSSGGSSGGGGTATATPAEDKKPTDEQKKAASNLKEIASYNADSLKNQLQQQFDYFDQATRQNRALADVERSQNSRKAADERFAENKKLQQSVRGLTGAIGVGLNGSTTGNLLDMINARTDLDNNDAWSQLEQNQNTVENAFEEAANQNALAKKDAAINAEYALRGLEGNLAADLNNIHADLYAKPGEGDANIGSAGFAASQNTPDNLAQLAGYLMPDNARAEAAKLSQPQTINGDDYYSRLINGYTNRKRGK